MKKYQVILENNKEAFENELDYFTTHGYILVTANSTDGQLFAIMEREREF